jgi:hypothetical protein
MTEYELKNLKSNTNYSIIVRLSNKAGYGERKIQKITSKIMVKISFLKILYNIFRFYYPR